jgi:hypothetical protein
MSWCLRKKGPLYVAMFGPLIVVFVAVMSSIVLDETLHIGMYVMPCLTHTMCGGLCFGFLTLSRAACLRAVG